MPATNSPSGQTRRVREKLSELILHLTGLACFTTLRLYDDHVTHRALDQDLVSLLRRSDASADLTLTCELLFLRFRDRVVTVGDVDGLRLDRLVQRLPEDRYTVVDRYVQPPADTKSGALAPDSAVRYTISLYGAQYLGPEGFDRAGVRLTLDPRHGQRMSAQALTRRGDALADALCADPAVNLQRACRYVEYGAAAVPDVAAVTRLLEAEEPLLCSTAT
jgi:hypothetical protein